MISWISNLLRSIADKRVAEHYARGFEYGAGSLLQGVDPSALEDQAAGCLAVRDDAGEAFDSGVTAACREWRRLTRGCR